MQKLVVQFLLAMTAVVAFSIASRPSMDLPYYKLRYVFHPNWRLLPHYECGFTEYTVSIRPRIVGGNEARLGQYPWMVGIIQKDAPSLKPISCGGSLINVRYVATAAHCVESETTKFVILGEHKQSTYIDCDDYKCNPPALLVRVEQVISHPADDISLLRLSRRITYSDTVRPICLPTFTSLDKDKIYAAGGLLEAAGWGQTEFKRYSETSDYLKRLYVPSIPQEMCKRWVPRLLDTEICTNGDAGSDTCYGDSGGPVMANYVPNPTGHLVTVLIGITSYGELKNEFDEQWPSCGNHVAVSTRVTEFVEWILDNLKP